MSYREWVRELLRAHRAERRYGRRCSGCWACDVLPVSETDRQRCKDLSWGAPGTVAGFDGHHVIPKQTLKRVSWPTAAFDAFRSADQVADQVAEEDMGHVVTTTLSLEDYLYDPRIGVPLRRWHHDQWEARRLSVPRSMIPAGVEEIAEELGLGWWLDRTFGEAVVG